MHSKSYLHFIIFIGFLGISVDGFHVNNSDTHSISGSIRSTDLPENTSDSLSESFIDLIKQLTVIQVHLETKTRDMEKRNIELSLKEKEAKKREAVVNQKEDTINEKETEVKNNEQLLKTREKQLNEKENKLEKSNADVRKQIEQLKQKEENIEKTETEIKKREETLKKQEEILKQKENKTCSVSWVRASNGKPANALVGGQDGRVTLYVGRANHNGSLIPGNVYEDCMYIADYGHEYKYCNYSYEVATFDEKNICRVCWVKASNGSVPTNAIVGGYDSHGEDLYIGRAVQNSPLNQLIPGKVQRSRHCLLISYNTLEHCHTEYAVAVIELHG
ncbi:uncharacterized protein LOC135834394 [Planococcus citri]|uniref:uncharacterized protein LOC135834394 n=1 Tax=Planococcus citri TaxID=170843 RepID=UPI0031F7748C